MVRLNFIITVNTDAVVGTRWSRYIYVMTYMSSGLVFGWGHDQMIKHGIRGSAQDCGIPDPFIEMKWQHIYFIISFTYLTYFMIYLDNLAILVNC